ncbi:EVE domain-containing protein [Pokkaliibacter sp. CJK22405]|uniref:EVE domain-containing protein n=1 Tax=Pokkaliibacter sp. CJK22405 TaxID=3384615 RepID=UPI003984E72A
MKYWLLKSEPDTFGIDHLAALPDQQAPWDGVRNYQARNFLRDELKAGDQAFFYHSSCKVPGIAGIVDISANGQPEKAASQPESPLYDEKHSEETPRWFEVQVKLKTRFAQVIPLQALKQDSALSDMALLNRSRLSVQPVSAEEWQHILANYPH